MEEFVVKSRAREELVNVTHLVVQALERSGKKEGIATVYVPHTTAGITINENADPDVSHDILEGLRRLVPLCGPYRHGEGNSDAHIKTSLVGNSVSIPFTGGKLCLGTWQGIFLAEFDGPRSRRLLVGFN